MAAVLVLLGCALLAVATAAPASGEHEVELRMPGVQPKVPDTYYCYSMKLGEEPTYLTGFIPHGNMSTAHHMLLYGCVTPGGEDVWNCGEMLAKDSGVENGPVCAEGSQIIYAWAMDAPMLKLPEGVGFKVGGDTGVQYLVLQVHYKDVSQFIPPINHKDNSGLTLMATPVAQPRRAGVYLLATDGTIPSHSTTYMESACSIEDDVKLHPFAFRVHTHKHGKVVSGFRVRDGQWKEIGRKSPQEPQMFYNVTDPAMTVEKGDIVAARCTMVDEEDSPVNVGPTQKDEMCNFYMMYYVDGNQLLDAQYCQRAGPPHWYWTDMKSIHAENAPGDASVVPGTNEVLESTEQHFEQEVSATEEDMRELLGDEFERLLKDLGDDYLPFNQDFDPRGNLVKYGEEDMDEVMFPRTMRNEDIMEEQELQDYYDGLRQWMEQRYQ